MSSPYRPAQSRYTAVPENWFRRCGNTGLMLPAISLGCWHNFGDAGTDPRKLPEAEFHANAQAMLFAAFDHGITHFDLANNYGPAPGSAEQRVGKILREDFRGYRDELIISTKAGYRMWDGPYGEWGSRKYLLASLDQSLDRLDLDYVDIFYSHRPDPDTPLEETLGALDTAVRSGKALYAGISRYDGQMSLEALRICRRDGLVVPIIHQPNYSMLNRTIERDLLTVADDLDMGIIAFGPLAEGLLTPKYLNTVPDDSRAKQASGSLQEKRITSQLVAKLNGLNDVAASRGQSLNQLAVSWSLRNPRVTSALIGASRPSQITENVEAAHKLDFTADELSAIDTLLATP